MSDLVERLRDADTTRRIGESYADTHERRQRDREEAATRIAQLEAALRAAYEVYAGSDGFIPETCAEGYQQQIITQMVDCISAALEART
jgi:hypothetical protein